MTNADHPAYGTLTPEEKYLWERQFRPLTEEEIDENRAMTPGQKLDRVDILNDIARRLEYQEYTEQEIEAVRQRWIKLKQRHAEGKLKSPAT